MSYIEIHFTENVKPAFTEKNKASYRPLIINQLLHVGNVIDGRRLVRALVSNKIALDNLMTFLNNPKGVNKDAKICDVRKQNGVRYGFQLVDGKVVPELDKNNKPITPYPKDDIEHDLHMQDVVIDRIVLHPPENSTGGFAGWDSRVD